MFIRKGYHLSVAHIYKMSKINKNYPKNTKLLTITKKGERVCIDVWWVNLDMEGIGKHVLGIEREESWWQKYVFISSESSHELQAVVHT